jgi:hypothetical protein
VSNLRPHLQSGLHKLKNKRQIEECIKIAKKARTSLVEPVAQRGSVLTRLVDYFETFLQSSDGKGFTARLARNHAGRLRTIFKQLVGKRREFQLTDLCGITKIGEKGELLDKWLGSDGYAAGSVINFIASLNHFLRSNLGGSHQR